MLIEGADGLEEWIEYWYFVRGVIIDTNGRSEKNKSKKCILGYYKRVL